MLAPVNSSTIVSKSPNVSLGEKTVPVAERLVLETTTERIDNDIYSTLICLRMHGEMWKAMKVENKLVRNQCHVTNNQVNVSSSSTQPEWQRFVTLVKQSQELKTVSYHKLYDILKQHQNEVNEIRTERLARTANPLALICNQSNQKTEEKHCYFILDPTYESRTATVTEDEEMSKEKEIDKLMALISLSFKKIYKPTNNNLRTSSNTSRANQDNSPRINRGTGYDNQRAVNVAGARENVGTLVVQKSGIQCYNCKEYGHVSRECQKPKRVKDAAYHKEKMELEAHYMYMAQIQELLQNQVDNSGTNI
ncbi:reverse transcriptase domain-containing protein [Tanacetum coccineum]